MANNFLPCNMNSGDSNQSFFRNDGSGFQALASNYPIQELSKLIQSENTEIGIMNAGESAIPDICAHVVYLKERLDEGNGHDNGHLDYDDSSIRAWVGILSMVALSKVRGYGFKEEKLNLLGTDSIMRQVYYEALNQAGLLDESGNVDVLYYENVPVALMDLKQECFCYPFSCIHDETGLMKRVNWYDNGTWLDVSKKNRGNLPYLSAEEKRVVVLWLDALKTVCSRYSNAITDVIQHIQSDIANEQGSIISLETTLLQPNLRPENITAWKGIMACIGLSKMKGFQLGVKEYERDAMKADITYRVFWEKYVESEKKFKRMHVLTINEVEVGILHSNMIVYPLPNVANIPNVPWCGENGWEKVELDDGMSKVLRYWYHESLKGADSWKKEIVDIMKEEAGERDEDRTKPPKEVPLNLPVGYGLRLANLPTLDKTISPDEVFTSRILLTPANQLGIADTRGKISNRIEVDGYNYTALVPLTASFTQNILTKDGISLDSLDMEYKQAEGEIRVELVCSQGEFNQTLARAYKERDIVYCDDYFPYVCMWPYIKPVDAKNKSSLWKRYFIIWNQMKVADNYGFTEQIPRPQIDNLGTISGDKIKSKKRAETKKVGEFGNIYNKPDNEEKAKWEVQTEKQFPEFIPMAEAAFGGDELGCIYVAPPKEKTVNTDEGQLCYAAIDFGTSNTIVRLIPPEDRTAPKPFSTDYVKSLISFDSNPSFEEAIKDFHKDLWLPKEGENQDKIPTMAQLYVVDDQNPVDSDALIYGRMMRTYIESITRYGSFKEQGIYGNFKISTLEGNQRIRPLVMEQILLDCAIAAMEGGWCIRPFVSYPNSAIWDRLGSNWTRAIRKANNICPAIVKDNDLLRIKESFADRQYVKETTGNSSSTGFCVVDIGGGTSDFSLVKSNKPQQGDDDQKAREEDNIQDMFSVQYAGNQIISESIYSMYCRYPDFDQSIWKIPNTSVMKEYLKTMKKGFDEFKGYTTAGMQNRADIKDIREQIPNRINLLFNEKSSNEKPSRSSLDIFRDDIADMLNPDQTVFCSYVCAKLCGLFYILAHAIKEKNAFAFIDNGPNYHIYLMGGGSVSYELMKERLNAGIKRMISNILSGTDRYVNRIVIFNEPGKEKTEVVSGMERLIKDLRNRNNGEPGTGRITNRDTDSELNPPASPNSTVDLPSRMEDCYKELVGYIGGFKWGRDLYHDLCIDENEHVYGQRRELYTKRKNQYHAYASEILNQVREEAGNSPLVPQIAAVKMVDYFLFNKDID